MISVAPASSEAIRPSSLPADARTTIGARCSRRSDRTASSSASALLPWASQRTASKRHCASIGISAAEVGDAVELQRRDP